MLNGDLSQERACDKPVLLHTQASKRLVLASPTHFSGFGSAM